MKSIKLCLFLLALHVTVAGAESVRNNSGSRSSFDRAKRIVTKSNHSGYTVWRSDPVAVDPAKAYCGKVVLDVLERQPGAMASVRLVLLNEDKLFIKAIAESSGGHQQLYALGKSTHERRSTGTIVVEEALPKNKPLAGPAHGASFMRLEVVLLGNPAKVQIIDPEIKLAKTVKIPGIYSKKHPYPDRDKTLEAMKKLPGSSAKLERRNGRLVVLVDGKETLFKSYKGSIDYGELHRAGINLIQSFNAGITLFWDKMTWDMSTMTKDGNFDFSRLENELLFMYHYAPDARVLLNVNVDVGMHFFNQYPDSIFRNEAGQPGFRQFGAFAGFGGKAPNPAKHRHYAVSYASEDYQNYVCNGLVKLAEFLKNSPAGKIVVGIGFNGGHDDQFLQWEYSPMRGQGDYSPAAIKAYRKYLKEKYKTDAALRKAWNDPAVTLDKAPLFSEKEWKKRKFYSAAVNGVDRKIADGRDFMTDSIAAMNRRFALALKQNIGKDVIVGTYYSSPLWGQAGRSSLHQLSQDHAIDAVFQVSGYSYMRKLGGIGASANFAIAAAHSAGLIYLQEMDHRTPRSQLTAGWSKDSLGFPENVQEFKDQILRDAGATIANGGDGFYYFDMFDSWFNDPEILKVIQITSNATDFAVKHRSQVPQTQIAVFLDEKERLLNLNTSAGPNIAAAARISGITPDIYLLDDLTRPLPEYKLWIMPDPLCLTAEQLAAFKQKAFKKGNVIIITGRAGALQAKRPGSSAETLKKLGITVKDRLNSVSDFMEFSGGTQDAILKGCTGRAGMLGPYYTPNGGINNGILHFSTVLDDPSFVPLAVWHASKTPAMGIKRTAKGTILYAAHPAGLTPQLLNNAAKEAGIVPHSEAGNAVVVGNGVISVHRLAQEVVLNFAEEMKFFDPETKKLIGEGKTFPVTCPVKGSRLINYCRK